MRCAECDAEAAEVGAFTDEARTEVRCRACGFHWLHGPSPEDRRAQRVRGGRRQRPRPERQFDAEAVVTACVEHGTAVEMHSRPERLHPPLRLLSLAVELGCVFAIDTDAHAPGSLDWQGNGCERAVETGVPADRVVSTWSAEDLSAWTER